MLDVAEGEEGGETNSRHPKSPSGNERASLERVNA